MPLKSPRQPQWRRQIRPSERGVCVYSAERRRNRLQKPAGTGDPAVRHRQGAVDSLWTSGRFRDMAVGRLWMSKRGMSHVKQQQKPLVYSNFNAKLLEYAKAGRPTQPGPDGGPGFDPAMEMDIGMAICPVCKTGGGKQIKTPERAAKDQELYERILRENPWSRSRDFSAWQVLCSRLQRAWGCGCDGVIGQPRGFLGADAK